ncbi:AMP-binding protein [bacterium]|nr:AMP-binding protein [bacterium]
MEKIWYASYPKGVPHEINPDAYPSLIEVLESTCKRFGTKTAFSNFGVALSFAEVDEKSRQFAAFLQSVGLKPGDTFAIQLPNLLQYPVALFGALRAGLVVVNTNPLYTAREMEFQFKDSGAKAVLICANFAKQLESVVGNTAIKTVIVTEIGDLLPAPKRWIVNAVIKYVKKMVPAFKLPGAIPFREALKRGAAASFQPVKREGQDLAFIQYTGGTTGVSKGAMLTHRNIVANMEQVAAWLRPTLNEGEDICLAPLPMYHIFSLTVNALALFKYGTHSVLVTNARDIPSLIKDMRSHKLTLMTGVNTLFNALMNHPDFSKVDFSSLKFCVGGAMALQKPVVERWNALTKSVLLEGYGLTESSPVLCVNPLEKGKAKIGTVGLPISSTEIKLMGENGQEAALGQSGEIWARGPQVMKGYWNRSDESKNVLPGDGWLRTGDVGEFTPEGFLRIVDRQKDMITVSGFKVYPNEVEEVLATHPKVLEAGVIGMPDEHSGEVVKAFVVRRDVSLTEQELREFAKKHLTAYKVPKAIVFAESLPKTNVGKILRRQLR